MVGVNLKDGYNGDLTSREAGSVGGQMVKKMIESYEKNLTEALVRRPKSALEFFSKALFSLSKPSWGLPPPGASPGRLLV